MKKNCVSIVIPCFKQAHLLPRAIESCLEQTYKEIEIVVVDDSSPDDVSGAVRPYQEKVELIHQEHQGLSAARNTGIRNSSGEFIKFLDSDDWLLPSCLEKQVASLSGLDRFVSICGYAFHYDGVSRHDEAVYPEFGRLRNHLCLTNVGPPHIYLFPKTAILEAGAFETGARIEGGHEDYDYVCRLALSGWEAVVLHEVGCVYCQSPGSMSKKHEPMRRTRCQVWSAYAFAWLARGLDIELALHLLRGYAHLVYIGDFRYEAQHIFCRLARHVSNETANLSRAMAILLLDVFAHLLFGLRRPEYAAERDARRECIDICFDVINRILRMHLSTEIPSTRAEMFAVLEFALSGIWVGRARDGRKLLTHYRKLNPRVAGFNAAVTLFHVLSMVFPGRWSVGLWRAAREMHFALRPNLNPCRQEEPLVNWPNVDPP